MRQRRVADGAWCSYQKVVGLIDDEALDVVEVRVGGGDFVDAEATCDSEVERVVGEQAVLFLQFQGDEEIVGANGLDRETAAEKVAHFVGIRRELPDQLSFCASARAGFEPMSWRDCASCIMRRCPTSATTDVLIEPSIAPESQRVRKLRHCADFRPSM